MKAIKITGVKKEIGEYRDWLKWDWRRRAEIMLDKLTGEVWTDCFFDCNTSIEYKSPYVISLSDYICSQTLYSQTREPITMQTLKKYAAMAIAEE